MKWIKRISISIATIMVILLIVKGLADRDISKIYGGLTARVDTEQFKPKTGRIIIANVNVLSQDGTRFTPAQNVTIDNGVIASISASTASNQADHWVDGKGKYLIPGLIDSHVHLFKSRNDLLLYIANGVTQIRELIGEEDHLTWRKEIQNGRLGPDLFIASPRIGSFATLEGAFMEWSQGFINITNAQQAQKVVHQLHKQGYDAVKIYSQINKETYFAVTQTAKRLGMRVVGHVPWSLEISDLYDNQEGIAHLEEVMNAINREFGGFRSASADEFLSHVSIRSKEIASDLKRHDIAVTTTLWLVESFIRQKFDLENVLKEVELEYQNPGISEWTDRVPQGGLGWLPEVNRYQVIGDLSPERAAGKRKYWRTYAKACQIILRSLLDADVDILAGTDTNLPPTVPGFSLHDEFISMNKAGMSPSQILLSATAKPAAWLQSNSGKLLPGYKASLVILDANPLSDIRNTKAINSVLVNGQLLERPLLDQILAKVKEANDSSRTQDINMYLE